jgi:hypothetical protein
MKGPIIFAIESPIYCGGKLKDVDPLINVLFFNNPI